MSTFLHTFPCIEVVGALDAIVDTTPPLLSSNQIIQSILVNSDTNIPKEFEQATSIVDTETS